MRSDFESAPPHWLRRTFGEFCKEVRRKAGDADLPVLTVSKDLGIVLQSEKFKKRIASSDTTRYKRVRRGEFAYDPMLLWSGSIARQERVDEGLISPAYYAFKADGSIHHDYFLQLLNWDRMTGIYDDISVGTNVRRRKASFEAFCSLHLPFPPLPEQKKIAAILSSVDEAIQATQAVIEQTRRVKEGLLQDLLTRGIGRGGRPHTRFKQTEIGEIPESWEVQKLGPLLRRIDSGWSPSCPEEQADPGHWAILKTTAVVWDGYDESAHKRLPDSLEPRPDIEVVQDDVLVTRAGPRHRVGVVVHVAATRSRLMLSDKIIRLQADTSAVHPGFLAYCLSGPAVQNRWVGRASGMADSQANISQKVVRTTPIALPSIPEQRRIYLALQSTERAVREAQVHETVLQTVKAGLLQDLLTGKVRVSL